MHGSRENKCSVGDPTILIRSLIPGPEFVFLNMGLKVTHLGKVRLTYGRWLTYIHFTPCKELEGREWKECFLY